MFMISSITSTYKDVVHILPVKSINYLQLVNRLCYSLKEKENLVGSFRGNG